MGIFFGMQRSLPVTANPCIQIGLDGGCGVECQEFLDGGCTEPQEISKNDVLAAHSKEEAAHVFSLYDCFNKNENINNIKKCLTSE